MDCLQFRNWLENRDVHDVSEADKAMKHASACPECRDTLHFDEQLDDRIARAMQKEAVPEDLKARVDLSLDGMVEKGTKRRWGFYGLATAMVAVLLLVAVPLWFPPTLDSMDEIGRHVIADHTAHGDDVLVVEDPADLGLLGDIDTDDFHSIREVLPASYVFVGARICPLGECEGIHLVFRDGARRVSLYLIDLRNVGFSLGDGHRYGMSAGEWTVQLWKQGDFAYALIG